MFALMFVLLANQNAFAGPAQFVIVNLNAPGVGFNDPTPAAPVGGNTGTTLGEQRLIAFQHAASIWSARLNSDVPIRIRAQFTSLAPNVLGSAGPVLYFRIFQMHRLPALGITSRLPIVWRELIEFSARFRGDDINANFSTNFNFYLGLDANHGAQVDLVAVLLHEFAHGLGFSQNASLTTGALLGGFPDAYNSRLLDTTTGLYWSQMTNAQRVVSATSFGRVVWDGAFVTAGVPNVLSLGSPEVSVASPGSIAGAYQFGTAAFGPTVGNPNVTASVIAAVDAVEPANPPTMPAPGTTYRRLFAV